MTIKPKVVFAPGCFDNFTGTQEELDAMIAEINEMVETGEFFDHAVNIEDMTDEERDELFDGLEVNIRDIQPPSRTLN
jgi:hypothetical protein